MQLQTQYGKDLKEMKTLQTPKNSQTPKLSFDGKYFVLTGTAGLDLDTEKWDVLGKDCVTVDFKAAAVFKAYADRRALKILERAFVKSYKAPHVPLPSFLDPIQVEGVNWVLTRSRSYLAHAPGAGKTCEAIVAAIYTEAHGQVVFIVPPQLTANWVREIDKFYGWVKPYDTWPSVYVVTDSSAQVYAGWAAEFIIVPDSMLTKDWVLDNLAMIKKRFVAVDEASRFKDSNAERTKVLFGGMLSDGRRTPGLIYDAQHVVLLDGSPMPNRPLELWAPTYAMSPQSIDFMSEQDFGFRYCGATINKRGQWEFKHSSKEEELKQRLQKTFMHVVPEEALNHPERKRSMLFMTEPPKSVQHRQWEQKNLSKINFNDISENMSQGVMASFRAELGISKTKWIAEYVSDRLERNAKEAILLFAWHREVCFTLEMKLREFKPGLVMGGTSQASREKQFEEFQSGKKRLLIMNIIAGGRGHNLQRASRIIFGEWSWSDEVNKQCEKRASRKGNESLFTRCEYIVAPNTMDEPILNAVFRKAERVKRIIG